LTSQLEKCFPFNSENISILSAAVDPRHTDLDFLKDVEKEEVNKVLLEKIAMIEREYQDVQITAGT